MPKSLGLIHTIKHNLYGAILEDKRYLFDNASALSTQLDHMIRHGNTFKLCGIDMVALGQDATGDIKGGLSMSGEFRYYTPTAGRCAAFRAAFHSARKIMNIQGIKMSDNKQYDFRVPLADPALYENGGYFFTAATLQGGAGTGLALYHATTDQSVFGAYNANLEPDSEAVPTFNAGLATAFDTAPTDLILNPGRLYSGASVPHANTTLEAIPFQLVWEPDDADSKTATPTYMFRPDPALYISVMTGQIELYIEYLEYHDDASQANIDISFYFAGWKSIMSDPKKRRSKRGKKHHGRKRRTSKR